jgi:hypothetical protein
MPDLLKYDIFPGVCKKPFTLKITAYIVFYTSNG